MKTKKNQNLPSELDTELQNLSEKDVQGLKDIWDLAGGPANSGFPDPTKLDQIWSSIEDQARANTEAPVQARLDRPPAVRQKPARIYAMRWLAAAAVLVVGLVGARLWFSPVTVSVPYGETASIELSDGSTIELNSGSEIKYARSFGDERRVSLQGEAFFDIVKEDRPFVVETFNSSVQVLGTTFNVKAWDSELKTVVALESGIVQVADRSDRNSSIRMSPGETARVQNDNILVSALDDGLVATSLAWRSGDFSYSEESLDAIFSDIERRFDTEVSLGSPSIGERKTKFNRKNPGSASVVLEELCTSMGLAYRSTNTGFEVYIP